MYLSIYKRLKYLVFVHIGTSFYFYCALGRIEFISFKNVLCSPNKPLLKKKKQYCEDLCFVKNIHILFTRKKRKKKNPLVFSIRHLLKANPWLSKFAVVNASGSDAL